MYLNGYIDAILLLMCNKHQLKLHLLIIHIIKVDLK